jgi:hypothetical protein
MESFELFDNEDKVMIFLRQPISKSMKGGGIQFKNVSFGY